METYLIIGAIVLMVIYTIVLYNRLVSFEKNRENAFADIDVQLKQRHDLIPQLVNAVKGYMQHEQKVLQDVTEARTQAQQARNLDERVQAEGKLDGALRNLQIQVEAYPDLKASSNFMQLQEEISDIENKVAASRRFFNAATRELNTAIHKFPSNMIASTFGFKDKPMFDVGQEERERLDKPPEVKF